VPIIEEKLKTLPGLLDVSSDLQIARPQVNVEIDREKASALGVTPSRSRRRSPMPMARARSRTSIPRRTSTG